MNYLEDQNIVLSIGCVDETGESKYGKPSNVPDHYVVALQQDLAKFGFSCGMPDGAFGSRTLKALRAFQRLAKNRERQLADAILQVDNPFSGEVSGQVDEPTRAEIARWLEQGYGRPIYQTQPWTGPEPAEKVLGAPFAEPTDAACYWPICTNHPRGREVAYRGVGGTIYGNPGRRFLADRVASTRYHVGVDLWADEGDLVIACEDGRIVACYDFTDNVDALIVQCDSGTVINYGEIRKDSISEFDLAVGSKVKAGQPLALIGKMKYDSMCHFETYCEGARRNERWLKGHNRPQALLNPTNYLLHLAAHGKSRPVDFPSPATTAPDISTPPVERNDLTVFHNAFEGGLRWRLGLEGIETEGLGIERTNGEPKTTTRIWENFSDSINKWAKHFHIPCELIIATIATESEGRPDRVRHEPGYISDEKTPHRVSPGLMQTLLSTARETLGDPTINGAWLLEPDNSIQAGAAYIWHQKEKTFLDPPKVACAYNSGGIYINCSADNRWRMRQYPIGSSEHCDRFIKWFNDAVYVLKRHATRPTIPFDILLQA